MKRLLALLLASALALSLAACGGKSSNISMDNFEGAFLLIDQDWAFTYTEGDGGSSFGLSEELLSLPFTVEGTADKKQMLKQAVVTLEGTPEDYFQDVTALSIQQDIDNARSVPIGRLATDFAISAVIIGLLDRSDEEVMQSAPNDRINLVLSAIDGPQTLDGWTYTIDLTGRMLTITVEYTG